MTEKRKQELRQLLNEAMENIVIDSPEGYEPISIEHIKTPSITSKTIPTWAEQPYKILLS